MTIDIQHGIRAYQTLFTVAQQYFELSRKKRTSPDTKEFYLRHARDLTESGLHIRAAFYADMYGLGVQEHTNSHAFNQGVIAGQNGLVPAGNPFTTVDESASWQNGHHLGHILFIAKAKLPTE